MEEGKGKGKATLYTWYQDVMVRHEFVANLVQGVILTALAVAAAGILTEGAVNYWELSCMVLIQATFINTVMSRWFKYLNRSGLNNLQQVLLDQFIFGPVFTASIIALKLYIESSGARSLEEIVQILIDILPGVITSSWGFWIPQRFVSISFVPPNMQLVFANVCAFFWNIIFTALTSVKK